MSSTAPEQPGTAVASHGTVVAPCGTAVAPRGTWVTWARTQQAPSCVTRVFCPKHRNTDKLWENSPTDYIVLKGLAIVVATSDVLTKQLTFLFIL